jgi:hypothetical protein
MSGEAASGPGDREILRAVEALLDEMVGQQQGKLLALARRIDPRLSADDLLSPYDFPGLAQDPRFSFEDGVLAGLISARTAFRARFLAPRRGEADPGT